MTQVITALATATDDFRNLFVGTGKISGRRGKVPRYMSLRPPPLEILDSAACTPGDAALFDEFRDDDEVQGRSTVRARRKRQAQAQRICNGYLGLPPCPVRQQCALWALKNKQVGVYGGQVVTAKSHAQYSRALALGDEPQPRASVA